MRFVKSAFLISVLYTSSAFAADSGGSLAAGKPAGLHEAQMFNDFGPIAYFGLVAVGLGVAYAVTHDNNNSTPAVVTPVTGTSTTSTTV